MRGGKVRRKNRRWIRRRLLFLTGFLLGVLFDPQDGRSSETLGNFRTTQRYNQDERSLHGHRFGNLKFNVVILFFCSLRQRPLDGPIRDVIPNVDGYMVRELILNRRSSEGLYHEN
jgi:hypothetical protein